MKIHLQKILHVNLAFLLNQISQIRLGRSSFLRFKFRRRKRLTCFCRIMCDRYGPYVYVMHVCNFHDLRVVINAIWQEPRVLPICVMACAPTCDDPFQQCNQIEVVIVLGDFIIRRMVHIGHEDGDRHQNLGYTDSQLYANHSCRFTSLCDNEFYAYGRSRTVDPSQILSYNALPTKSCTVPSHVRLVVDL